MSVTLVWADESLVYLLTHQVRKPVIVSDFGQLGNDHYSGKLVDLLILKSGVRVLQDSSQSVMLSDKESVQG